MELKDLIGPHELSGIDMTTEYRDTGYQQENVTVVRFILDGITYVAIEDPDDGYRSFCTELGVSSDIVTNTFAPQAVIGRMKCQSEYRTSNIIEFLDMVTGKVVLELGTENTDDYYPCCIMHWYPENLACNKPLTMEPFKNHVKLTGLVQFDPEIREIAVGRKVARLSLMTKEVYEGSDGEEVTDTQYHTVVAWGKVADQVDKLVSKDMMLNVDGRLIMRYYTNKEGSKRYITEIVLNSFTIYIKPKEQ